MARGVCAFVGCNGDLPIAFACQSDLLVHVRDPSSEDVAVLRQNTDAAGLDIHRLAVELGLLDPLPYADNVVDCLITTQVSPARFELATGRCLAESFDHGKPKANNGRFVGAFRNVAAVFGGRILYSAPENISNKNSFFVSSREGEFVLNEGGIPPAWNDHALVLVNYKHGQITCCDAQASSKQVAGTDANEKASVPRRSRSNLLISLANQGAVRCRSDTGQPGKFEALSLAVCANAVVGVVRYQRKYRSWPQQFVVALDIHDGNILFQKEIHDDPLPSGLLVDRNGQIIVTMLNGKVNCLGPGAQ